MRQNSDQTVQQCCKAYQNARMHYVVDILDRDVCCRSQFAKGMYLQILEYHVYSKDAYEASDFKKHSSLVTKEGESLKVGLIS